MSALDDAIAKVRAADDAPPRSCPECGVQLTKVAGRRQGVTWWWCWKCEAAR